MGPLYSTDLAAQKASVDQGHYRFAATTLAVERGVVAGAVAPRTRRWPCRSAAAARSGDRGRRGSPCAAWPSGLSAVTAAELEPGRVHGRSCSASAISTTVSAQPANVGDDRHCAIAQRAELGEAARLGTATAPPARRSRRGSDARGPRHSRSRRRSVRDARAPPPDSHPADRGRRCRAARELHAFAQNGRDRREQEVEALLPGQPADDAEHAACRGDGSRSNCCCSVTLFASRSVSSPAPNRAAMCGSVSGFHTAMSMPLRMPLSARGALAQQRHRAPCRLRRSGSPAHRSATPS